MSRNFIKLQKDIKKLKASNARILSFTHNGKEFLFIGEVHSGIKQDISHLINNFDGKILSIIECYKDTNKLEVGKIRSHYKKQLKENRKIKNDSYIDNHIYFFINKYKNFINKNKQMKDVMKNKKVKVICIDERKPSDYPKSQVRTVFKKDEKKMKNAKNMFSKLKKKILKMEESPSKTLLLKEINSIINVKINKKSSYLLQTLSEISLDYEIINNYILNDKIKEKFIIGIFGNNHINNVKKYFDTTQ